MRKKEAGQAFILVLILLAIGALLIVPALRLTSTELKSSQIVGGKTKTLYALSAAQEWMLWNLTQPGFTNDFILGVEKIFEIDVCGTPVTITIVMQALPGTGGITLATDDVIRPMKTVYPDTIPNDTWETCTYTINLEQLSTDNSQGLDAIYDILPKAFASLDYEAGRSYLSVDGGPWESIPDPDMVEVGGQVRLKWPADYDHVTGTGAFSSDPLDENHYFHGIRDFEVRQVKELKFEVTHEFKGEDKDSVHCNWVVLKPWDTLSGPQAPITVGDGSTPEGRLLEVSKTSNPEIIQPGVETDIEYTISITNQDTETHQIQEIIDYLPPGFTYIGPTSGITTSDPQPPSLENLNGVDRWVLRWTTAEFPGGGAKSINAGETVYLTFWARTTKDVSGSYYNEVIVIPDVNAPPIFSEIGVSDEEYYAIYSWNTGAVMVPYYDSEAEADGESIDTNFSLTGGGVEITSWQIR